MRNAAKKLKVYIKNVWRSKNLIAFVFLMPWILGFLIFQAVPFITSLCYSFTNLSMLKEPVWVGLDNSINNSDYLQKARKYGHFTGYKN